MVIFVPAIYNMNWIEDVKGEFTYYKTFELSSIENTMVRLVTVN